jgi:hypothetical protein
MAMVNSIFFMVVRLVGGWLGADLPLSPITYAGAMPDLFRTLVAEGKWPISRGENNFANSPNAAQNRSKPGFNGSENGKFLAKAGSTEPIGGLGTSPIDHHSSTPTLHSSILPPSGIPSLPTRALVHHYSADAPIFE